MAPEKPGITFKVRAKPLPFLKLRSLILGVAIKLTCSEVRLRAVEDWGTTTTTPWKTPTWEWALGPTWGYAHHSAAHASDSADYGKCEGETR